MRILSEQFEASGSRSWNAINAVGLDIHKFHKIKQLRLCLTVSFRVLLYHILFE